VVKDPCSGVKNRGEIQFTYQNSLYLSFPLHKLTIIKIVSIFFTVVHIGRAKEPFDPVFEFAIKTE